MASLFSGIDPSKADPSISSLFDKTEPVVKPKRQRVSLSEVGEDHSKGVEEQTEELIKANNKKRRKTTKSSTRAGGDEDEEIAEIDDRYLQKLMDQEFAQTKTKKSKKSKEAEIEVEKVAELEADDPSEDDEDEEKDDDDDEDEDDDLVSPKLLHESLVLEDEEVSKAKRTIFVGNVPSTAISSKSDYIQLKKHFLSYGPIESIRFRSIAFSEMLPRKVAFIKQKLHGKRHTVNAYIVFESEESSRKALTANGTLLLDHHIRVDSVAHPAKQDVKRSVFIGNLDFEAEEEALWQHFSKIGEVDYVRIIRDSKTNVGKGFGYVQFKDSMYVSKALLENDKKIAGRKLRVTRARTVRPPKNDTNSIKPSRKLDPDTKAKLGRAKKIVGKAERAQLSEVVEGERAKTGIPSLRPGGGNKNRQKKPRIRARSTAFRKKTAEAGKGAPNSASRNSKPVK